jgi:cytochrome c553
MKYRLTLLAAAALVLTCAYLFPLGSQDAAAQTQTMPDVIILGKDAKLGQVTFNHLKHNSGEYNIVKGEAIACVSCHHTAQPAVEAAKHPPLATAWPADRTTTLTKDLFDKDPKLPESRHAGTVTPARA